MAAQASPLVGPGESCGAAAAGRSTWAQSHSGRAAGSVLNIPCPTHPTGLHALATRWHRRATFLQASPKSPVRLGGFSPTKIVSRSCQQFRLSEIPIGESPFRQCDPGVNLGGDRRPLSIRRHHRHLQPALPGMDYGLRQRTPHRRAPRPHHPPCPHPGDERTELQAQAEPISAPAPVRVTRLLPWTTGTGYRPGSWYNFAPPLLRIITPPLTGGASARRIRLIGACRPWWRGARSPRA